MENKIRQVYPSNTNNGILQDNLLDDSPGDEGISSSHEKQNTDLFPSPAFGGRSWFAGLHILVVFMSIYNSS